ncbi:hybrid sensor histidine kinase/response regulator [Simiduia agarivorans]|uniref:Sensory/regulatory protein RpfC n=1 Tax=Simiduia agarivorans (strain DSM 21679 / JCM 13881 / BCRC 17597 / SA1) TaxID=1117647 RepID=K4KMU0_SIMAS|nr:response regulator [Simiduia agarivorans]AFU99540.1 response regulator receiver domain-containing protein [Simiduia agarivorans SA1 = DSM 21679]
MDKKSLEQQLADAQARIAQLEARLHAEPANNLIAESEAWLRKITIELFDRDDVGALTDAMAQLGEFLQVDDCVLAQNQDGQFVNVLHWQRYPDRYPLEQLLAIKMEHMPDAYAHMREGRVRQDPDVVAGGYVSPEAAQLISHMNIGAYITVPVLHHGELHSFLVLIQRERPRRWTENDVHVAETFSALLTLALTRQESLRALGASQQRYQDALAATRDGIWEWDLRSQRIFLSEGVFRMLGYAPEARTVSPEEFKALLHPDERHQFELFERFAGGDHDIEPEFNSREVRMRHKSGREVWCFVRAKFVGAEHGQKPTKIVGVNADISRFKAVQEELTVAKSLADSASQAKSEFLTRMSHEIRTPMNAIIGMGHLLSDTRLSRTQKDYLSNIDQAANSLLGIINEILDFAKIEAGTIVLEHNHFDLSDALAKLVRKAAPAAERKNLEVLVHMAPEVPHYLRGDSLRLRQALFNLLDNAIKFTHKGEIQINVSVHETNTHYVALKFDVCDRGIGMTREQLAELFTPFMQADGSTRRRFGGTGLGLTVSKHLIELMHGEISVNSSPGQGSQFSFTARFGHSVIGALPVRDKSQKFRHLKTLVVDDNKAARQILTNLATHLDLHVTSVASAAEAFSAIELADRDQPFDLVLMDYQMPEIDGLSASRTIKEKLSLSQIPAIILVSAFHRDEVLGDKQSQTDIPVESFISKPISQSHLFDAIAEVFGDSVFRSDADQLPAEQLAKTLKGVRVLLAEDNVVNQKVAVGILNKMDVAVDIANNGQEAIDLLNSHACNYYGAVLMDMEMPEVDGYDATRRMRAGNHCKDIPIIAMTAHAMRGDKERCLAAGMDAYITKPVKPELLYQTLASFIAKSKQTQPN